MASAPKHRSALRLVRPELTLARRGNGPDPRMVELVRLLARRAALEVYEEQMKGKPHAALLTFVRRAS